MRGGGWDLPLLQRTVDQFVLHYDVCGVSRRCFHVLHDQRGLSVHFMLDIDGTIYQSLDLKERAWHASAANDRSVGVEIANVGAVPASGDIGKTIVGRWYATDERGVRIVVPEDQGDGGVRTANFVGRPVRQEMVMGTVQGQSLRQYDLTPQQYASLVKLTAALCTIFPKIDCDYPKDASGQLITRTLDEESLKGFSGLLGHYHLTAEKLDPGPALQWEKLAGEARKLMRK